METTDQVAEETRRVIRALQEGARRVNEIRELIQEHAWELESESDAFEAAARRLAEKWDLVDSSDLQGCTGGTPAGPDIEVAPGEVGAVSVKQPNTVQGKSLT